MRLFFLPTEGSMMRRLVGFETSCGSADSAYRPPHCSFYQATPEIANFVFSCATMMESPIKPSSGRLCATIFAVFLSPYTYHLVLSFAEWSALQRPIRISIYWSPEA